MLLQNAKQKGNQSSVVEFRSYRSSAASLGGAADLPGAFLRRLPLVALPPPPLMLLRLLPPIAGDIDDVVVVVVASRRVSSQDPACDA